MNNPKKGIIDVIIKLAIFTVTCIITELTLFQKFNTVPRGMKIICDFIIASIPITIISMCQMVKRIGEQNKDEISEKYDRVEEEVDYDKK